jgi:hypothetical protein
VLAVLSGGEARSQENSYGNGGATRTSMRRHCLSSRRGGWCQWPSATASALRAMLLSALPRSHTLGWLCAFDEIRLVSGYQSAAIFRAVSPHARWWTEFACAVALCQRSEALSQATAVARRHASAVLASSPLCQDHLLFVHSPRSFASFL